jgi:hypothetical protein
MHGVAPIPHCSWDPSQRRAWPHAPCLSQLAPSEADDRPGGRPGHVIAEDGRIRQSGDAHPTREILRHRVCHHTAQGGFPAQTIRDCHGGQERVHLLCMLITAAVKTSYHRRPASTWQPQQRTAACWGVRLRSLMQRAWLYGVYGKSRRECRRARDVLLGANACLGSSECTGAPTSRGGMRGELTHGRGRPGGRT